MTSNSAGTVIKLPCVFTREAKDTFVSKRWQDTGFLFFLVSFFFLSSVTKFDKRCANSTKRSQSPEKFTLLDEVIYHQVIPLFWK